MNALFLSILAFASTTAGGLLAIRFRKNLHYIMGFTAGVILGVVAFDILPEIAELATSQGLPFRIGMIALVIGFLLFHFLEKAIVLHHSHEDEYAKHTHPNVGVFQALALSAHSFMDGVGIGLGFLVSPTVGLLVAIAVISHDFTDGMNTVTFMLHHKNTDKKAKVFLAIDALAPILGAISTLFFHFSPFFLLLYLGFFAGSLLYIGASDILPEAHREKSSGWIIALTVLGAGVIYVITQLI
ncbi:MAG: ZIP family metal transporter [Patescibacteria group bacterium]